MKTEVSHRKILLISVLFCSFCFISKIPICHASPDEIIISEFMANPKTVSDATGEWLEFYNAGLESVNLNNWLIETQNSQHLISQDLLMAPGEYLVVCKNSNPDENGNIPCSYQYSGFSLVNTNGEIKLINENQIVFALEYSAAMVSEGKSTEFADIENIIEDNYFLPENWHFSFNKMASQDFGTPGEDNSSPPEISEINEVSETNESMASENSNPTSVVYPATTILITEILPNPTGLDGDDNEFIELYNPNAFPVNLLGWKLSNKKEQEYAFENSFAINPESYVVIYRKDFNFTLYNQDGIVSLFNEEDKLIDVLSFNDSAETGQSLNKDLGKNVFWSDLISPKTEALKPKSESLKVDQKALSSKLFTKIIRLNQLGFLENLTDVSMKGLVVSPPGIPQQNSFYLQKNDWGVLVKVPGSSRYKPGDYLEIKGVLHQTQKYNYIKVAGSDDIKKIKSGKISYYNLGKCLKGGTCLKKLGSVVKFTGEFFKKTSTTLYFKNEGNEIGMYLPNNLYLDISALKKGDFYEIKGVLEKTSSVFRILATGQDSLTLISKESNQKKKPGSELESKTLHQKKEGQVKKSFPVLLKKPTSFNNKIQIIENISKNEIKAFSLRENAYDFIAKIFRILASMA